jgi:alpha-1,4-digalacturonate transport system substrate-binding protein
VPGHLGLAKSGVDYPTASPQAAAALKVFSASAAAISPEAIRVQGYLYSSVIYGAVISRLGQAITGEISLDDAYSRITAEVAQQIAEKMKK